MQPKSELRLGAVRITADLNRRSFLFENVHDPAQSTTIEDADVADLILFLYSHSRRAPEQVHVQRRNTSEQTG